MITKKQLRREIEELKEQNAKHLKDLGRYAYMLKNLPKFKIDTVVGKYRVIEIELCYCMEYYYQYRCIKDGEYITVSEESLIKKAKKHRKKSKSVNTDYPATTITSNGIKYEQGNK